MKYNIGHHDVQIQVLFFKTLSPHMIINKN